MDSKQCCLYVMLFACVDSELFAVNVGAKMIQFISRGCDYKGLYFAP